MFHLYVDDAGGDRSKTWAGKCQGASADRSDDGEVGEIGSASRVGVLGERPVEGATTRGDRDGDRNTRLSPVIPVNVAQLHHRLLRKRAATRHDGRGSGGQREGRRNAGRCGRGEGGGGKSGNRAAQGISACEGTKRPGADRGNTVGSSCSSAAGDACRHRIEP